MNAAGSTYQTQTPKLEKPKSKEHQIKIEKSFITKSPIFYKFK